MSARGALGRAATLGSWLADQLTQRITVRRRLRRVRARQWFIVQCAVAAAVAWWVASDLFDKPQPFFAPVAALICLGMTYGQRLRRMLEVLLGVAVGVAVGDLFVSVAGVGVWQIAVAVCLAMSLAVFLSVGVLIVIQAGVQAVIVTTLIPSADAGLSRWLDALIGGLVALAVASVAPSAALRRPRGEVIEVLAELREVMQDIVTSARSHDAGLASAALQRARRLESSLDTLRQVSAEALAAAQLSPLRRPQVDPLRQLAEMADPLDHAVRNVRVLARRVLAGTSFGERIPDRYLDLVVGLAESARLLADRLADGHPLEDPRAELRRVAAASAELPAVAPLTPQVVLAQARSITVDLLESTGLSYEEAVELVPVPNLPSTGAGPNLPSSGAAPRTAAVDDASPPASDAPPRPPADRSMPNEH